MCVTVADAKRYFIAFLLLFSSRRLVVTQYNIIFSFYFNHTLTRARLICAMTKCLQFKNTINSSAERQQTRDRLRFFYIFLWLNQFAILKSMYEYAVHSSRLISRYDQIAIYRMQRECGMHETRALAVVERFRMFIIDFYAFTVHFMQCNVMLCRKEFRNLNEVSHHRLQFDFPIHSPKRKAERPWQSN